MTIRPYQTKAEEDILTAWQSCQRVMFQLPTGGGKTICVTNLIRHLIVQGKRIMFIAHREELISQAWQTFYKNKIVSGIVKSGIEPNWALPVQIGSVQTMTRRKALPKADYFIIDEAHHCLEDNSYGRIIKEHYPEAFVLGVTATPYRLGGRGFTKVFDILIESVQLSDLIQMGYLVPLRYFVSSIPDLTNVKITAGDYAEEQAAKAMGNAPIVESYKEHADGLTGLVFAVTVEHSKKIVEQYTTAGVRAEHVDANTPLDIRRGIFQRLRDRTTLIVVNVGIATEGVDIPNIDFVQLARPTKSLSLFFQMIGRGTRADNEIIKEGNSDEDRRFLISCSSKPHCIILDNAGLWAEHGLPDQPINWQKHFNGYKRPKKTPEEMIEILEYIAEDEDGRTVRTKIPKEVEGLKLIEIRKTERDRIVNLTSLKEFDRLYALFKNLPKINKPGFKAYFEYREHCLRNSFLMTDDVWAYLDRRLVGEAADVERELQSQADKKFEHIMTRYGSNPKDKDFLMANVQKRLDKDFADLRRVSVPAGFLKKEKQKYETATKAGIELLHVIPAEQRNSVPA